VIPSHRIDVATIVNKMANGSSVEGIMDAYQLSRQNVPDALAYARKAVLKDSARIQRRLRRGSSLTPAIYEGPEVTP